MWENDEATYESQGFLSASSIDLINYCCNASCASHQNGLLGLQSAEILLQHLEVPIVIAAGPGLCQRVDNIHLPSEIRMMMPATQQNVFGQDSRHWQQIYYIVYNLIVYIADTDVELLKTERSP
jgi:hypothetical protein